jgi:hypothetical protein
MIRRFGLALAALPLMAGLLAAPPLPGSYRVCRGHSCLANLAGRNTDTGLRFVLEPETYESTWWRIQVAGKVSRTWPFSARWADRRWLGKQVVYVATYRYSHEYAAGPCSFLIVAVCLQSKSSQDYWVAVPAGSLMRFVGVRGTDVMYDRTGRTNSYLLEDVGSGSSALIAINGDVRQFMSLHRVP